MDSLGDDLFEILTVPEDESNINFIIDDRVIYQCQVLAVFV